MHRLHMYVASFLVLNQQGYIKQLASTYIHTDMTYVVICICIRYAGIRSIMYIVRNLAIWLHQLSLVRN